MFVFFSSIYFKINPTKQKTQPSLNKSLKSLKFISVDSAFLSLYLFKTSSNVGTVGS